jgi:hypothetical protein
VAPESTPEHPRADTAKCHKSSVAFTAAWSGIVCYLLQGLDEPFLEQWHQKLHQNTTPEDVTICEAYLAYLHSGNHDDYWRVLWDNGRITKEHLEGLNIPIKGEGALSCYNMRYIVHLSACGTMAASQRSTWSASISPSRVSVETCYNTFNMCYSDVPLSHGVLAFLRAWPAEQQLHLLGLTMFDSHSAYFCHCSCSVAAAPAPHDQRVQGLPVDAQDLPLRC